MAKIIKFFGLFFILLVAVFVSLGHTVMFMLYGFNTFLTMLWPSDPQASSSLFNWFTLEAFGPGVGLWVIGYGLEKFGTDYTEKPVPQNQTREENAKTEEPST